MNQLRQGSPEWHAWRLLGIGGSDAPVIMGVSPWMDLMTLWKIKVGEFVDDRQTDAMRRGIEMEPVARAAYETHTGNIVEPALAIHPGFDWMRASLDGLSFDGDVVIEIKCPGRSSHNEAKEGRVPDVYWPQVQHCLLVTGAARLDYWSFDGAEGVLVPVEPDAAYQLLLIEKERAFWELVKSKTPPTQQTYEGKWTCEDPTLEALADQYILLTDVIERQTRDLDKIKAKLYAACRAAVNTVGPLTVSRTKGRLTLDQKALEASGVDLSTYRKRGADYWLVKRSDK
jgi:putative phage-type endonuclease